MNTSLGTASILEILWTVCAAPGLWVWAVNLYYANQTNRAAKHSGASTGARVWARFSVLLTAVFAFVEIVFITVGVISMVRAPSPSALQTTYLTYILTFGFLSASALITIVGVRWRAVDQYLVASARARKNTTDQR